MSKETVSQVVDEIKAKIGFRDYFQEHFPDHYRDQGHSFCPFHNDKTPSFEVKYRWGVCHAGCVPNNGRHVWDVIAVHQRIHECDFKTAVNELAKLARIETAEPPPEKRTLRLEDAVTVYDYIKPDGELAFKVCRFRPTPDEQKPFRPFTRNSAGKWVLGLKGVKRILYNIPRILKASPSEPILWVEGEKDADTATHLGFPGTTSFGGANGWAASERDGAHLILKDRIVWLLPDNDEPSRDYVQAIAQSLQGVAQKVLVLPPLGKSKGYDLSDYVRDHGEEAARQKVLEFASQAAEWKPPRTGPPIISFSELMSKDLPEPQWIIPGLLCEGLCMLAGPAKVGKSWFVHGLSLAISRGDLALGRFAPRTGAVLHLALEDTPRRFRSRMAKMLCGAPAPESAFFANQWPPLTDSKKEPDGLDHLHNWLEENHETAKLIVIDTLFKLRPQKVRNEPIYERDYKDLEGFQLLAGQYGIAVVVVHHTRKEKGEDSYDQISGSTGLTACADTVMILKRESRANADGTLEVSGRDIEAQRAALLFDNETGLWRWIGDAAEVDLTHERRKIREALIDAGKPMSISELSKVTGKGYEATKKLVYRMVDKAELAKALNQKYRLPPEDAVYGEPWKDEKIDNQEVRLDRL
ncbi:MAG: AAA family ATPase [Thermodesulfobacteriota bacterium]